MPVRGYTKTNAGQMQIGEMVVVLVIFFILVGAAVLFFTKFMGENAQLEYSEQRRLDLAETAKLLTGLPELHCAQRGEEEVSCIDLYKALLIAQKVQGGTPSEQRHYSSIFPDYHIELKCIYPSPCTESGVDDMTIVEGPANRDREEPYVLPVSIYNPATQKYLFGTLIVWQVAQQ